MNLIAHRGNTQGIKSERENTNSYLLDALELGFYIECDIMYHQDELWLGHDYPVEPVNPIILKNPKTIAHAKDIPSLIELHRRNIHCFWHEEDRVTHTNRGLIWCYPGEHPRYANSILLDLHGKPVPPEAITWDIWGICSDDFTKWGIEF